MDQATRYRKGRGVPCSRWGGKRGEDERPCALVSRSGIRHSPTGRVRSRLRRRQKPPGPRCHRRTVHLQNAMDNPPARPCTQRWRARVHPGRPALPVSGAGHSARQRTGRVHRGHCRFQWNEDCYHRRAARCRLLRPVCRQPPRRHWRVPHCRGCADLSRRYHSQPCAVSGNHDASEYLHSGDISCSSSSMRRFEPCLSCRVRAEADPRVSHVHLASKLTCRDPPGSLVSR
eukprot:2748243-Pleurochrysis_carterae.AAC.1